MLQIIRQYLTNVSLNKSFFVLLLYCGCTTNHSSILFGYLLHVVPNQSDLYTPCTPNPLSSPLCFPKFLYPNNH